jgi:hypothetical protein
MRPAMRPAIPASRRRIGRRASLFAGIVLAVIHAGGLDRPHFYHRRRAGAQFRPASRIECLHLRSFVEGMDPGGGELPLPAPFSLVAKVSVKVSSSPGAGPESDYPM